MDVVSVLATYTTPTWITAISTDFADVPTMATDLLGVIAPITAAVMLPMIGYKLFKKFIGKIG